MFLKFIFFLLTLLIRFVFGKHKSSSVVNNAPIAQTSPLYLKNVQPESVVILRDPEEDMTKVEPLVNNVQLPMDQYPEPDQQPAVNHPEVQAVVKQLDMTLVPKIQPRKVKGWDLVTKDYDFTNDPDCWWSATVCKTPKLYYLPEDIYQCPQKGDWGLNYDDGPYKAWWPETERDKEFDQPRLYNFLAKHGKQKATLFSIRVDVGSNVLRFPSAAIRALSDGHVLCSHTWSHPQMTTLTNQEIVAQLYWTQKVIKQATGVTPKCWRPPYGDVDDRVRAIAWQMGMRTILWDQDSFDWNLSSGHATTKAIDGYFKDWIKARKNGTDNEHGHITLQHENSNHTILLSEKWLPRIQKAFRVMPIHQCLNDPHPYWEQGWEYPTLKELESPKTIGKGIKIIDKPPKEVKKVVATSDAVRPSVGFTVFSISLIAAYFIIKK